MILKKIIIGEPAGPSHVVADALEGNGFPVAASQTPVLDSLGSVALSDWNMHPVIKYTEHQASQSRRPFLHINIDGLTPFEVPYQIQQFIETYRAQYLHLIAAASEKSPTFGERIAVIIDNVILMGQVQSSAGPVERVAALEPLAEAVLDGLSLRDKAEIANMGADALRLLQLHVGDLMESKTFGATDVADSREIMGYLWQRLRETHSLRVVD